jgi:dipeptidyl aminopeptidase/acylaminoacyl peptidase
MRASVRVLPAVLLLGVSATLAGAQANSGTGPTAPPAAATTGGGKKALNVPDYARWRSIGSVAISDDGTWATWSYTQRNTDDTLFLKNLATDAVTVIPRASGPQFSDDMHWLAYSVASAGANRQGGGGRGGAGGDAAAGGGGGGGGGARRAELRDLKTGAVLGWDNTQSFVFNKGSTAFLIRKARAAGAPATAAVPAADTPAGGGRGGAGRGNAAPAAPTIGTDLILHHLKDGADELIGSVSASEFNRAGALLAYTVSSADRDGNGLYLESLDNWSRRALDNAKSDYSRMTWDSAGTAIAVLRGMEKRGFLERENTLVVYTGLDTPAPVSVVIGPGATGLPEKMVISDRGTLTWSPDRSRIFVALKEPEARPAPARRDSTVAEEPVGNVDVWHWKDPYIQSVQMVRAQQDKNRTYVATALLAEKKIVPLADPRMQTVQITRDGMWGIGRDGEDYVDDWKQQLSDYYRVNTTTGERVSVLKAQLRTLGLSADGKYFLYWKDAHVWAYDMAKQTHTNITKTAPVSFVDMEEDHVGEKPAYGVTGFSSDGKYVLLDHKYDLWQVSLDGSAAPKNLTKGVGSASATRFRYERIEPPDDPTTAPGGGGRGGRGGGGGPVIDLAKPVPLSAFGDTDKKDGFYELRGDSLLKLAYEDRGFGRAIKARNADKVLITRETYAEFPDYWVTDTKFTNPKRLTNANPQQSEYLWGHRVLFDYKDKDGHKLQGTLAIPDNYQPGQKLPMLVDYYEKYSQNLNRYSVPRYATAPQFADYVSNGYLVMQPDVYYHTGASHTDMLNSVEAAVKRVVELGYADPKHVGLHGHSYSGQGSAYISTTSKMFAAVVAGAAATDLVADFNQLWKTSGTSQHQYDIYGQGRFGTNPYDNLALFMDQSAVFHAKTMDTPLLLLQGTNDGSVEWLQGVEFYNALRFLKKPVIFLSYEGEAHGFTRYDNQYDVMVRMHQFYDTYLKGAPAADWIANGIPFLKKKTPTGAAAQPVQLMGGGAGIGTPGTAGGAAGAGGRGGGG